METRNDRWHHSPPHLFLPENTYFITARTLDKVHIFNGDEDLRFLESVLFQAANAFRWDIEAWAVFSNHYHFVAVSPENAKSLPRFIGRIHSQTARAMNKRDRTTGRQVWFNYWDTCLTFEDSYFARLNYVNNNAVHHGLVKSAEMYPFCSAPWFAHCADPAYARRVASYKYDNLDLEDDF
jgi:putative transposase